MMTSDRRGNQFIKGKSFVSKLSILSVVILLMSSGTNLGTVYAATTTSSQATTAKATPTTERGATNRSKHADEEEVIFGDLNIEKSFRNMLGLTNVATPVTYGAIHNIKYGTNFKKIFDVSSGSMNSVTSLQGLESLLELPDGWGVSLRIVLADGVSLVPMAGLTVTSFFAIARSGMGSIAGDIETLNSIEFLDMTGGIYSPIEITGVTEFKEREGLTNEQLQQLDPMFTKAVAAGGDHINISFNRITDYHYFAKFTAMTIASYSQYQFFGTPVYHASVGQDLTGQSQVIGIDGKPIQTATYVYNNETHLLEVNDTSFTVRNMTSKFDSVILYNATDPDQVPITYSDGSTLVNSGMQYYALSWDQPSITVRYLDELGTPIGTDDVYTGDVGSAYTVTPKDFAGYKVDTSKLPANANGMYANMNQTITFSYVKTAVPDTGRVVVRYIDESGDGLYEDQLLSNDIGTDYDVTTPDYQLTFPGYTLKVVPANAIGTFTAADQTVTYVYTKNQEPIGIGQVVVKYVDEAGKRIKNDLKLTGQVGHDFKASIVEIKGYQFKQVASGSLNGKFSTDNQTTILMYTKDSSSGVKPIIPNEKPDKKPNTILPQTNEADNSRTIILLLTLTGSFFLLLGTYYLETKKK